MELNTFFISQGGLSQVVGGVVLYVYFAVATMLLAQRLSTPNAWLAWVPVANLFLMVKMAGLEWWWTLGFFVPFANIFIAAYVWSEIGKKLGKPWWMGLLVVIPLVGWLMPGYFVVTTRPSGGAGGSTMNTDGQSGSGSSQI